MLEESYKETRGMSTKSSLLGRSHNVIAMNDRRKKRRKNIITAVIVIAGICLLAAIAFFIVTNFRYKSYKVIRSTDIQNSFSMNYEAFGGGMVRYSRDGMVAMDSDGRDIHNGSYEMENPKADVCEDSVVVADIGEKTIYAYNEEKSDVTFSTDYPILEAKISKQGVVAALVEDTASNTICIYDAFAETEKLLAEIPTNIEQGYPVAIDISNDGTSVVSAYASVTDGVLKSKLAFYNFTDVGKNTNSLVGAQEYDDRLISEVRYIDDASVAAFFEKGFCLWKNLKKPKQAYEKTFKKSIKHAFCGDGCIGVALDEDSKHYRIYLYGHRGGELIDKVVSNDYTHADMYGDEIFLTSADKCAIYRTNGVRKLACNASGEIVSMYPAKGIRNYFIISAGKLEKIRLGKG